LASKFTPKIDTDVASCLKEYGVLATNLARHLDPGNTINRGNIDKLVEKEMYRMSVDARAKQKAADNWAAVAPQFLENVKTIGPKRAVKGLMVHDIGDASNMVSAEGLSKGYFNLVVSGLDKVAEEFGPTITGGQRNKDILRDTVRVLMGATAKLDKSQVLAKAMREALDKVLHLYRDAGGVINHIDNYFPQNHNMVTISKAGRENWKAFITPSLDRTRMTNDAGQPLSDTELGALLDYVYNTITTQGASKHSTPPDFSTRQFSTGMSGRHAMQRVLHFKDADAALTYHDKFGTGDLWGNFTQHIQALATDAALLKNGLDGNEKVQMLQRWSDQAEPGVNMVSVEALWKNMQGFDNNIDSKAINLLEDARNIASAAYMGNVLWASLPDIATNALNRHMNGMKIMPMLTRFFSMDNAADRSALVRAGGGIDAFTSSMGAALRWEDPMGSGLSRRLSDANYRLGGATAWMNRHQHTWTSDFMGMLQDQAHLEFDNLPRQTQTWLKSFGLVDSWDTIRKAPVEEPNGFKILKVSELDDADLAARVLGAINTERNRAQLEPDVRVRAAMNQGMAPTTWGGQALRSFGQFKSFMGTYATNAIGRYLYSQRLSTSDRYAYFLSTIVGMTLLGAVSNQIREILKGKDPLDPLENPKDFWLRAAAQGGSMPLLADLVLEGETRHGRTGLEATFGATGGMVGDIYRNVVQFPLMAGSHTPQENRKIVGGNLERLSFYTPFSSLWWARVGVQRGLRDTILGLADETYAARMQERERNLENRSGQGVWFGYDTDFIDRITPDRAPKF
jgi:hypothetical protein